MRRFLIACVVLTLVPLLAGCVVYDHHGYYDGYWHEHRRWVSDVRVWGGYGHGWYGGWYGGWGGGWGHRHGW